MRGVAALGAVAALRRLGELDGVKTVVGTSAGALVATAFALGKVGPRLVREMAAIEYVPDVNVGNLLGSFGLDDGRKNLDRWISLLLDSRPLTFRQVRETTGVRLVVCATNVTDRRPEYFNPDDTPDMDVALALRMSCAVPLYFSAVRYGGKVYVDGAVSDNFPLERAAHEAGRSGRPGDVEAGRPRPRGSSVIGIAFSSRAGAPEATLQAFVSALIECSTRRNEPPGQKHVLRLDTGAKSAFDFGLDAAGMQRLYASGARQARAWHKKRV